MKKNIITLSLLLFLSFNFIFAQKGVRIAFIDMDIILKNLDEYKEASLVLNKKIEQWENEIRQKEMEMKAIREEFRVEKIFLTEELVKEKEKEIKKKEEDIIQLQVDRFGPKGDLAIQKRKILQPIQDQILNIVQKIAVQQKYDYVFDRSSNIGMLYSTKKYDISNQVLKNINIINRKRKIEQNNNK